MWFKSKLPVYKIEKFESELEAYRSYVERLISENKQIEKRAKKKYAPHLEELLDAIYKSEYMHQVEQNCDYHKYEYYTFLTSREYLAYLYSYHFRGKQYILEFIK